MDTRRNRKRQLKPQPGGHTCSRLWSHFLALQDRDLIRERVDRLARHSTSLLAETRKQLAAAHTAKEEAQVCLCVHVSACVRVCAYVLCLAQAGLVPLRQVALEAAQ